MGGVSLFPRSGTVGILLSGHVFGTEKALCEWAMTGRGSKDALEGLSGA
jgi:hypothetical protein